MAAPQVLTPLSLRSPGAPPSEPLRARFDPIEPEEGSPVRCMVAHPPWRSGDGLGRRGASISHKVVLLRTRGRPPYPEHPVCLPRTGARRGALLGSAPRAVCPRRASGWICVGDELDKFTAKRSTP